MILDPSELKAAREARRMTQKDLERATGILGVCISRIETTGKANCDTMRALTRALGIVADVPEATQ